MSSAEIAAFRHCSGTKSDNSGRGVLVGIAVGDGIGVCRITWTVGSMVDGGEGNGSDNDLIFTATVAGSNVGLFPLSQPIAKRNMSNMTDENLAIRRRLWIAG